MARILGRSAGRRGIRRLREPWQIRGRTLLRLPAYEGEVAVASIEDRTRMTSDAIRGAAVEGRAAIYLAARSRT
jgi:hypothetical protein